MPENGSKHLKKTSSTFAGALARTCSCVPYPRSRVGQNVPLGKILFQPMQVAQRKRCQTRIRPRKNACAYGARVSGPTLYNYFRNYQPNQGRYTQGDPIGLAGGVNRFGYVDASPLSYSDPEGLQARPNQRTGPSAQPMFPRIGPTLPPANPQVGTVRNPIEIRPGTNLPGEFNGVPFSGHSFDRTQGRGIPPSVVIDTILTGRSTPGSRPNTTQYYDPVNNVTVVVNATTGNVITLRPGPPSNSCIP